MLYIFYISARNKSCFPSLVLINLGPISYSSKGSWTHAVVVVIVVVQVAIVVYIPYIVSIIRISRAGKNCEQHESTNQDISYRFNPILS